MSKITIGCDLQKNKTPIFIIRKITSNEKSLHLIYLERHHSSNGFKNIFINFIKDESQYHEWFKNRIINPVLQTNKKNELINTMLYKFNWVIKNCIKNLNNESYKYNSLFLKFIKQHLINVVDCITFKCESLIEKQLIEPWTIAYEMTKQNYENKELFNIAYIDFYETKLNKYKTCLDIFSKK